MTQKTIEKLVEGFINAVAILSLLGFLYLAGMFMYKMSYPDCKHYTYNNFSKGDYPLRCSDYWVEFKKK